MTKVFEDIKLEWDGQEHTVPSDRVLPLIARIEEVLTQYELAGYLNEPERISQSKLAQAYGAALRFSGAPVSDEDVYLGLYQAENFTQIAKTITSLMALMIPPKALGEGNTNEKKPEPEKAPAESSKPSTSSPEGQKSSAAGA